MNNLEAAITAHYGERCPDFDESCPCCQAWEELDKLGACRSSLSKALPKLINRMGDSEDDATKQVVLDAIEALTVSEDPRRTPTPFTA